MEGNEQEKCSQCLLIPVSIRGGKERSKDYGLGSERSNFNKEIPSFDSRPTNETAKRKGMQNFHFKK